MGGRGVSVISTTKGFTRPAMTEVVLVESDGQFLPYDWLAVCKILPPKMLGELQIGKDVGTDSAFSNQNFLVIVWLCLQHVFFAYSLSPPEALLWLHHDLH